MCQALSNTCHTLYTLTLHTCVLSAHGDSINRHTQRPLALRGCAYQDSSLTAVSQHTPCRHQLIRPVIIISIQATVGMPACLTLHRSLFLTLNVMANAQVQSKGHPTACWGWGGVGECELHVGTSATTRVALPTGVELDDCTNETSRTGLNSLCLWAVMSSCES
jgi:hypothetical protein